MSEWKLYKLGEIARFQTGKLNSNAAIEGGKYPFFTCSPTTLHIDNYAFDQEAILLAGNNAEGNFSIKYYNGKFNAYQRTYVIEAITEYCETRYLFYSLKLYLQHFKYISQGTSTKFLTASILRNIPISLPPLETQKRIADILSAIDDKIELNRRINANLEQQAQALYKSWFVDDKKDDWEEKRLDDIISIYDSQRKPLSGQQREKMEKLYPYYGAASLMDYVDNYLFDGIYLLLGEDGTVSDSEGFPMLQYVWGKFWVNNHAHILQGKNGFTTESLYILLKQTNVSSIVTGAVQPKISQANLKSVPITMPPINLLNQYNNIIKPIFNQIRINHNQIQQLSTLRDTLLPKLMSGEIKVPTN